MRLTLSIQPTSGRLALGKNIFSTLNILTQIHQVATIPFMGFHFCARDVQKGGREICWEMLAGARNWPGLAWDGRANLPGSPRRQTLDLYAASATPDPLS